MESPSFHAYIIWTHVTAREFWATNWRARISNTITMTIQVDTRTNLYGDEVCVVINLDT